MPQSQKTGGAALPAGVAGWSIETSTPEAGAEHPSSVRIVIATHSRSRLTAAGITAVLGAMNSYLTASKIGAIQRRAGDFSNPGCHVTRDSAFIDVLPEDASSIYTTLCGLFQTAANVSAP